MEDYKPNSNRFKAEQKEKTTMPEKRVKKPVVTGKVTTRKPSAVRKIAGEFISDDAKNVKSYVFGEVLIPAIKKLLYDIVTDGADIILFGGARGNKKRSISDRVSYRDYYDRDSRSSRDVRTPSRTAYSYDDIELDTRGEAEEVLSRMDELIDEYKMVRVADLYDLVGITGDYTDNYYGWINIRNAEVVRLRNGKYTIRMPRAVPIEK